MTNSNYLTEIKKEYTIQLVNILTPSIYEGINSIYNEVKKIAKDGEELKIFQGFLLKIPTWTEQMITIEATRIKTVIQNADILDDLIKAVIQSNILLLTSTDLSDKHKVLKEFNINLNYTKFIHNVYIEVAKTFYNYPFLFFHKVPALEYKKNQLKSHKLIKESIEEAIRKMLPLQLILKKYLGTMSDINDDKYIRSLVNSESNNKQYKLASVNSALSNNDSEKKLNQIGGLIQSQVPISLKEIYDQQKNAVNNSTTIKHLPLTETKKSETKKQELNKMNIIIPSNNPNQVEKNGNDSETSQAYHKQDGNIEEEFSNMGSIKKSVHKSALDTVTEVNSASEANNKNIFNFRNY